METHLVFDLIALVCSYGVSTWFRRQAGFARPAGLSQPEQHNYYLLSLLLGLALGSLLFGTLNVQLAGKNGVAKSMLGGIFGAIFAAEVFKQFAGIRQSTGLYFVPGLVVLIAVGRLGCFFAGLPDFTYGTPSNLPWSVDFGDGVLRHPVQLYESIAMLAFLGVLLSTYKAHANGWQKRGFYIFVLFYASQRFAWEFIKPYPTVVLGLNLFQWMCLTLFVYALVMLKRSKTHAE